MTALTHTTAGIDGALVILTLTPIGTGPKTRVEGANISDYQVRRALSEEVYPHGGVRIRVDESGEICRAIVEVLG